MERAKKRDSNQLRPTVLIVDMDRPEQEQLTEYLRHKQHLQYLVSLHYSNDSKPMTFSGRREIPIDDDDVYRMGGSAYATSLDPTEDFYETMIE